MHTYIDTTYIDVCNIRIHKRSHTLSVFLVDAFKRILMH